MMYQNFVDIYTVNRAKRVEKWKGLSPRMYPLVFKPLQNIDNQILEKQGRFPLRPPKFIFA
jgi:hypothetical protein